ncbi:MAG: AarF/UbiB family protein [bacterium]
MNENQFTTLNLLHESSLNGNDDIRTGREAAPGIRAAENTPSFAQKYVEEVEQRLHGLSSASFSEKHVAELKDTGELLDRSDPMYALVEGIMHTLKPEADFELFLSKDGRLKANTLSDHKTVVMSAGLISKLNQFTDEKKTTLNQGHLALILAHEFSHWDPEAKMFHLNETYCDVNALFMMSKKYCTDDAVGALEFLQWIEEKEKKDQSSRAENEEKERTKMCVPITHPSSENRRVLGLYISQDPSIHLNGRYIAPKEVPGDLASRLKGESESFQSKSLRRQEIFSEEDISREFENTQTLSQILEVFLSSDEFYRARIVKKFAHSWAFQNVLLAQAILNSVQRDDIRITKDDFKAQWRAENILTDRPDFKPKVSEKKPNLRLDGLTQETAKKVRLSLDGICKKPFEALVSASTKTPNENDDQILKGVTFDRFFENICSDIEDFVAPSFTIVKSQPDLDRLALLKMKCVPDAAEYVSKNGVIDMATSECRRDVLTKTGYALASAYLECAQSTTGPSKWSALRDQIVHEVKKYNELVPDYSSLHESISQSLLRIGHCQTYEVANDLALMIVRSGYFSEDAFALKSSFEDIEYVARDSTDKQILADVKKAILSVHMALDQGGPKLGNLFGRPRIVNFIDIFNQYCKRCEHSELFDIAASGGPTITIPHQDMILDKDQAKIDLLDALKKEAVWMSDINNIKTPEEVDEAFERFTSMLSKAHNKSSRELVLKWMLSEESLGSDMGRMRQLLSKGVEERFLFPEEIKTILDECGDLSLYREYLPYLSGINMSSFHERWYADFSDKLTSQGMSKLEIVARFVEEGGVGSIEGSSRENTFRPRLIPKEVGGLSGSEIIPGFPFEEANAVAKRILAAITKSISYSPEERIVLTDVAARLLGYTQGLTALPYEYADISLLGVGVNTVKSMVEKLRVLPPSEFRDVFVLASLFSLNKEKRYPLPIVNRDELIELFSMVSENQLRKYDIGQKNSSPDSTSHPLHSLPLGKVSHDAAERYPFWYVGNSNLLDSVEWMANQTELQFPTSTIDEMSCQIDVYTKTISHPSGVRDYLIERTLLPIIKETAQYEGSSADEKIKLFRKAYGAAHTPRTKHSLANELIRYELNQVGRDITFEQGLKIILELMPNASSTRDQYINTLMNSTFTTWDQVRQGESLIAGHNYSTDSANTAVRSGMMEAVSFGIQKLKVQERKELMIFLLETNKHVLSREQLTDGFFSGFVKGKLRDLVVGDHFSKYDSQGNGFGEKDTVSENEFEEYYEEIKKHFMVPSRQSNRSAETNHPRKELTQKLSGILSGISLPILLQLATPEELNKFLVQQMGSNEDPITATSFGPLFLSSNDNDRRQIVYRMCLGEDGFFEEKHYSEHGASLLESLINVATTPQTQNLMDAKVTPMWPPAEIETIKKIITTTFGSLTPERRTEIMARLVNAIADSGGKLSKEQLVQVGLSAFGVVGNKIGQMDSLIPESLRDSLASLKEDIPPLPKSTVALMLRDEGRQDEYVGLGATKGGSTASISFARSIGGDETDTVIKMIRPDILKTLDQDVAAAGAAMRVLHSAGKISVDPDQILKELRQMIAEELDTTFEKANTNVISQRRKRLPQEANIQTPTIKHGSRRHLEISIAQGISLQDLEAAKGKSKNNEPLTEKEKSAIEIDIKEVYKKVVSDFLHQTFRLGIFHTDLHQGNIFIGPQGVVTEIDHGQVGFIDSIDQRDDLVKLVLSLALNDMKMASQAIAPFCVEEKTSDDIQKKRVDIQSFLMKQPDLLMGISKYLSQEGVEGNINRFIKAFINISPYLAMVDKRSLAKMFLPYITSKSIIFDIGKIITSRFSDRLIKVVPK